MAATVFKLFTATDVPPGTTFHFTWNNVPEGKAYSVDADPYHFLSHSAGPPGTTQAEVTRFWRRTRVVPESESSLDVHNDVLGHVKNVGDLELNFRLYLTVFS